MALRVGGLRRTAEGGRWEYGYDEHGNLTEVRDPLGNSTFTTWPVFAFPLKEVLPDGGTGSMSTTCVATRFEWNERGQLVRDEDCSGNQSHRLYDVAARRTRLRLGARPPASGNIPQAGRALAGDPLRHFGTGDEGHRTAERRAFLTRRRGQPHGRTPQPVVAQPAASRAST